MQCLPPKEQTSDNARDGIGFGPRAIAWARARVARKNKGCPQVAEEMVAVWRWVLKKLVEENGAPG
jgi:hypothetical protein